MEGTSPLDELEVQHSGLSHTLNYTEEASRRGYKKGLDGKITQSKIIKLEVAFSIIKYPEHKFSFSLGYILRNQESQVTLIIITIFFFFDGGKRGKQARRGMSKARNKKLSHANKDTEAAQVGIPWISPWPLTVPASKRSIPSIISKRSFTDI